MRTKAKSPSLPTPPPSTQPESALPPNSSEILDEVAEEMASPFTLRDPFQPGQGDVPPVPPSAPTLSSRSGPEGASGEGEGVNLTEVQRLRADLDQVMRALAGLTRRLGLEYVPLSTKTADVRAAFRTRCALIEDLGANQVLFTPDLAEEWGAELMRITPGYLGLVREVCSDPTPWVSYLRLVELAMLRAPHDLVVTSRWAYGLLATGSRTVISSSYLLIRDHHLPGGVKPPLDPDNDHSVDTHVLSLISYLKDRVTLASQHPPIGPPLTRLARSSHLKNQG